MIKPSEFDIKALKMLRENINNFLVQVIKDNDKENKMILEIGPSTERDLSLEFKEATLHTLDIVENQKLTFNVDICMVEEIKKISYKYDAILLFEVLEHVKDPFTAVKSLNYLLKPKGRLYISTPFNFRIHGPLPDNWRFTIHGLKVLLSNGWDIEKIETLETPERSLMPVQYLTIARKI